MNKCNLSYILRSGLIENTELEIEDKHVSFLLSDIQSKVRVSIPWGEISKIAELMNSLNPANDELWDEDISSELYRHPNPTNPSEWGKRSLDEIKGICFHHTLSQSPHFLFQNYGKSKKRPTGPYTLWITADGRCLKCVDLRAANWHNHTGNFRNLWLSVGLTGELHKYKPPEVQLERAALLVADICHDDRFSIDNIDQVKGHDDFYSTQCPGWKEMYGNWKSPSGNWRDEFYAMIEKAAFS